VPDSGIGGSYVSPAGIIIVAVLLILVMVLAVVLLVALWPTSTASGVTTSRVGWFRLGFAAISALVGLFSPEAADKLKQIFSTLFAPSPPGRDALAPDPAEAGRVSRPGTSGDPDHGAGGAA
jgi:hypothetical protein